MWNRLLKYASVSSCLIFAASAFAQTILRDGTTLQVATGTNITLNVGEAFHIEPNTAIENNGVITLLGDAYIDEADGYVIQGSGTETSLTLQTSPLVNENAGGLGLSITQSTVVDSLIVTRGHSPLLNVNGTEGVARWYYVRTTNWSGGGSFGFQLDNTEFNSLSGAELVMHGQSDNGNWRIIPGVLNSMNELEAYPIDTLGTFTLFEDTLVASVPDEEKQFAIFPNPTSSSFNLLVPNESIGKAMRILDALGKVVIETRISDSVERFDVSMLRSGIYIIEIQGFTPIQLRKE
jgi:hypothetical protein